MARETVEFEIDGRQYLFGRRGVMKAIKLSAELTAIILPIVGDAANSKSTEDLDIGAMIQKAAKLLTPDKLESILLKCLSETRWLSTGYADTPISECFDEVFLESDMPHIFKVTRKALEVDIIPFLGEKVSSHLRKAQNSAKEKLETFS